jgi:predicted nucleotidyltransferase
MIDFNESELIALCRDLDLSLVVLFGSQAQGQARDNSDIDIAVLSDRLWDQALESDHRKNDTRLF